MQESQGQPPAAFDDDLLEFPLAETASEQKGPTQTAQQRSFGEPAPRRRERATDSRSKTMTSPLSLRDEVMSTEEVAKQLFGEDAL
jgi:hypothetical protein